MGILRVVGWRCKCVCLLFVAWDWRHSIVLSLEAEAMSPRNDTYRNDRKTKCEPRLALYFFRLLIESGILYMPA